MRRTAARAAMSSSSPAIRKARARSASCRHAEAAPRRGPRSDVASAAHVVRANQRRPAAPAAAAAARADGRARARLGERVNEAPTRGPERVDVFGRPAQNARTSARAPGDRARPPRVCARTRDRRRLVPWSRAAARDASERDARRPRVATARPRGHVASVRTCARPACDATRGASSSTRAAARRASRLRAADARGRAARRRVARGRRGGAAPMGVGGGKRARRARAEAELELAGSRARAVEAARRRRARRRQRQPPRARAAPS